MKTDLNKLQKKVQNFLTDYGTSIEDAMRKEIPELFPEDRTIFIKPGNLFMRETYTTNLYTLSNTFEGLKIYNITNDSYWSGACETSKGLDEEGLNKYDFNLLLRKSGVTTKHIKLVSNLYISEIHSQLFFLKNTRNRL